MKGDAMKAALNLRVSGVLAGEGNPVKEGSTHDHVASYSSDIGITMEMKWICVQQLSRVGGSSVRDCVNKVIDH
ncbi:hypothetical protein QQF64_027208 [Cirrhinus molitorella]|uniref:Uncharacterized protein n=1 Tax=Cirrhinus molitorella TaxID=172907 RepID=A0ABR3NBS9_9TELE